MAAACTGSPHVVPARGLRHPPGLRHLLIGTKSPHSPLPPCRLSVCSWAPREHVQHLRGAHPAAVHVSPAQRGAHRLTAMEHLLGGACGPRGSTGTAEGHLVRAKLLPPGAGLRCVFLGALPGGASWRWAADAACLTMIKGDLSWECKVGLTLKLAEPR